jgi:uncharacterized protein YbgA (DUF1722 family)
LIGRPVRYDGGHARTRFVADQLGEYVDLKIYTSASIAELGPQPINGFILNRDFGVRRYDADGNRLQAKESPLFAQRIRAAYPHLPIEEEGRLNDPALRHQFLVRVFAAHRAQLLRASATKIRDVMVFHRSEKLLLMAHNPPAQRQLGRLIGQWDGQTSGLVDAYVPAFLRALRQPTHRGRMVNALQHMAGYLRGGGDDAPRYEVNAAIARFQSGHSDARDACTLLRHHIRHQEVTYLADQTILAPYPPELRLEAPDGQTATVGSVAESLQDERASGG